MADRPPAPVPPLVTVWEEVSPTPDEGYDRFAEEAVRALRRLRPVVSFSTPPQPSRSGALLLAARQLRMLAIAARVRMLPRPRVILYASRNPLTVPAVIRAVVLRVVGGGRVVLMVVVPNKASPTAMRLLWWLRPHRLLVSSEADRASALRAGVPAAVVASGVDAARFRPARRGERATLRRRHGLRVEDRVILHVGHLRGSRGLDALLPLAGRPGMSVVVVASHRRWRDSERVRALLGRHGVVVLDGFQPRIEELYRLADCYVFPGADDGAVALPLSILEAAASGLPIVSVPYQAVVDRRAEIPGLVMVERAAEIPAAVDRVLGGAPPPAAVPPALTWDGVAATLATAVAGVEPGRWPARGPLLPWLALAAGRWWRSRRPTLRPRRAGREEPPERPVVPLRVEVPHSARAPAGTAPADRVLLLGSSPGSTAAGAAELLGLRVDLGPERLAAAVEERWPLAIAGVRDTPWSEAGPLLRAFLRRGGTLYLEGLAGAAAVELEAAERALELELPRPDACGSVREIRLEGDAALWGAHAGLQVAGLEGRQPSFAPLAGWAPGLRSEPVHGARPLLAYRRAGGRRGRVVASALAAAPAGPLAGRLAPATAAAVLAPLALLRALYGDAAWQPPAVLANVTIDDPALVERRFGLPYRRLAGLAVEAGFHLTVATIPAELFAADPAVTDLFAVRPGQLSACYHGCDHAGYEFGLGPDAGLDAALLARQRATLRRAATLGRRFTARHGLALDRVMVFPHGIGAADLLPELWALGFMASANYANRLPLASEEPACADLGARPADLAWHGFPLLWRRPLEHRDWALDLLLGRPVLLFGHSNLLAGGFDLLTERAAQVARAAPAPVAWRGLEEIARHAYLQRRLPDGSWEVLMTALDACLHNPEGVPRRCRILRPHLPPAARLEIGGRRLESGAEVEIPPASTLRVRVAADLSPALPVPASECTLLITEPGLAPGDRTATA